MSDITKQSLTELVENIKNKKLSSTDVTKAFIERSEKSKELNAYVTELVLRWVGVHEAKVVVCVLVTYDHADP